MRLDTNNTSPHVNMISPCIAHAQSPTGCILLFGASILNYFFNTVHAGGHRPYASFAAKQRQVAWRV